MPQTQSIGTKTSALIFCACVVVIVAALLRGNHTNLSLTGAIDDVLRNERRVHAVIDIDGNGDLASREVRTTLARTTRTIGTQNLTFDVTGNGVVDDADVHTIVEYMRSHQSAVCGNGTRDVGEECDDGNQENALDGCSNMCTFTDQWWIPELGVIGPQPLREKVLAEGPMHVFSSNSAVVFWTEFDLVEDARVLKASRFTRGKGWSEIATFYRAMPDGRVVLVPEKSGRVTAFMMDGERMWQWQDDGQNRWTELAQMSYEMNVVGETVRIDDDGQGVMLISGPISTGAAQPMPGDPRDRRRGLAAIGYNNGIWSKPKIIAIDDEPEDEHNPLHAIVDIPTILQRNSQTFSVTWAERALDVSLSSFEPNDSTLVDITVSIEREAQSNDQLHNTWHAHGSVHHALPGIDFVQLQYKNVDGVVVAETGELELQSDGSFEGPADLYGPFTSVIASVKRRGMGGRIRTLKEVPVNIPEPTDAHFGRIIAESASGSPERSGSWVVRGRTIGTMSFEDEYHEHDLIRIEFRDQNEVIIASSEDHPVNETRSFQIYSDVPATFTSIHAIIKHRSYNGSETILHETTVPGGLPTFATVTASPLPVVLTGLAQRWHVRGIIENAQPGYHVIRVDFADYSATPGVQATTGELQIAADGTFSSDVTLTNFWNGARAFLLTKEEGGARGVEREVEVMME